MGANKARESFERLWSRWNIAADYLNSVTLKENHFDRSKEVMEEAIEEAENRKKTCLSLLTSEELEEIFEEVNTDSRRRVNVQSLGQVHRAF